MVQAQKFIKENIEKFQYVDIKVKWVKLFL